MRSPLAWIVAACLALRWVGLTWGVPASDAWDNDGIAPRDFLPGLAESFTPGHYFTYPPAHLLLLAIVTLPISIVLALRAPSFTVPALMHEALKVPYMTSFTLVARAIAIAMSIGIVIAIAKMVEEVSSRRASYFAGAACALNAILTYYAQTSNLDVPYLFWATLALLALTRAIVRSEPRRLRAFAVYAAIAIATKDQAYALFVIGAPAILVAWLAFRRRARENATPIARELILAFAIAIGVLLLVDGAIANPSGFRARLHFLAGPASQPFAYYSADARGRFDAFVDSLGRFGEFYPLIFSPIALLGLVHSARIEDRTKRLASFVPLAAILSFTLAFNCVARRDEHRFLLPQMTLWAAYIGIGCDALLRVTSVPLRRTIVVAGSLAFAWALFRCAAVDANMLLDPRYDAEAWLAAHIESGDTIEVQGKSVYLLRLPQTARVVRVDSDDPAKRNPLYGAEEQRDAFLNVTTRRPKWIVVSEANAEHFLFDATSRSTSGRIAAGTQIQESTAGDAKPFYRGLKDGTLGYDLVHTSRFASAIWPRVNIHGSLSFETWIFERRS